MDSMDDDWQPWNYEPSQEEMEEELELIDRGKAAELTTLREILAFLERESISHVVEPKFEDPDPQDIIIWIETSLGAIYVSSSGSMISIVHVVGLCELLKFDAYAHCSEVLLATLKTWISIYQPRENKAH